MEEFRNHVFLLVLVVFLLVVLVSFFLGCIFGLVWFFGCVKGRGLFCFSVFSHSNAPGSKS